MEKSKVKSVLFGALAFITIVIVLTACFFTSWIIGLLGIFLLFEGFWLGIRSKAVKAFEEIKDVFVHNAPDAFKAFMENKAFEVTIDNPQTITVSTVEIEKD